jgi:hypothetical protein
MPDSFHPIQISNSIARSTTDHAVRTNLLHNTINGGDKQPHSNASNPSAPVENQQEWWDKAREYKQSQPNLNLVSIFKNEFDRLDTDKDQRVQFSELEKVVQDERRDENTRKMAALMYMVGKSDFVWTPMTASAYSVQRSDLDDWQRAIDLHHSPELREAKIRTHMLAGGGIGVGAGLVSSILIAGLTVGQEGRVLKYALPLACSLGGLLGLGIGRKDGADAVEKIEGMYQAFMK